MSLLIALIKKIPIFTRYMMVGLVNTCICIFIMYLGAILGLNYLVYTALGTCISMLFSFCMNLRFTFKVKGQIAKRLSLFFLVNLINLLIIESMEYFLIEGWAFTPYVAIFYSLICTTITGFFMNNYFVYRQRIAEST